MFSPYEHTASFEVEKLLEAIILNIILYYYYYILYCILVVLLLISHPLRKILIMRLEQMPENAITKIYHFTDEKYIYLK